MSFLMNYYFFLGRGEVEIKYFSFFGNLLTAHEAETFCHIILSQPNVIKNSRILIKKDFSAHLN